MNDEAIYNNIKVEVNLNGNKEINNVGSILKTSKYRKNKNRKDNYGVEIE